MREILVSPGEAGQRLDKLLARYLNTASVSFLYKMMRKKNITLNGKKAVGKELVQVGDSVKVFLSDDTWSKFSTIRNQSSTRSAHQKQMSSWAKIPPLKKEQIIYEDDHILLMNKPAGVLSQKAQPKDISINEQMIAYLLQSGQITEESLQLVKPAVCNRLDRNTSGLVLCGKSLAGLQALSEALKLRTLKKYYLALVLGKADRPGHQKAWLSKDTKTNQVKVSTGQVPESSPIETAWEPVWSNGEETLLKVELITGKSHQIRCHLASLGYPLAGDPKYGNARWNRRLKQEYGLKRQFLHAWQVEFPRMSGALEALSGKCFTAPLPDELERITEGERKKGKL